MKDEKFRYSEMKRCYHSHPPLKIGGLVIYGGSCLSPVVTDADIYVGFEHSMRITKQAYPWNEGECFLFPITDGQPPKDVEETRKLIGWLQMHLSAGKKVHVGCIGGHGRTGTILSALVKEMLGEEDAITYVRENYCQRAVESKAQVQWLHEHFGIKEVKPSKTHTTHTSKSGTTTKGSLISWSGSKGSSSSYYQQGAKIGTGHKEESEVFVAQPQESKSCIWGSNAI